MTWKNYLDTWQKFWRIELNPEDKKYKEVYKYWKEINKTHKIK